MKRRTNAAILQAGPDVAVERPSRRAVARPAATTSRARERPATDPYPHVLSEELFRGSLIRYRQHVDRTDRPLVLMLVALNPAGAQATATW